MKIKSYLIILNCLLFLVPITASSSHAISISYEVNDMIDITVGKDLWQYAYYLQDQTFNQYEGFDIYFAIGLYDEITPVSQGSAWDVLIFQPDALIPADGLYDAVALSESDNPSLTEPFVVNFVWLGSGNPGAQFFEIYNDLWEVTAEGMTSPVPEPATILLIAFGILGFVGANKRIDRRV